MKKSSNRLLFHTFWLVICELMRIRIRIQLITLMRIGTGSYLSICADPDLQYWEEAVQDLNEPFL